MSNSSAFWLANPSTGFYNGDVQQSLRLFGTTGYLDHQFSTPTSQRKMIFSVWVKPSQFGDKQHIMGGGSGGTNYFLFSFSADGFYNATDSFKLGVVSGNSTQLYLVTDRLFRDPTNWTHVCVAIDTTQATASNRLQLFFNGKRYTGGYAASTYPSENLDIGILNSAMYHQIGLLYAGANYGHFDGYLADFYFLDGQSIYSDTSATINSTFLADADTLGTFCEQKNGVAIPKAYAGATSTYGNNGFRLEFKNTSAGGSSPSSSTFGADTSGKDNHFNDYNTAEMQGNCPDSPENNFCVMKPASIDHQSRATPANGGLEITNAGSVGWGVHTATFAVNSGKWWYEACASGSIGIGYNVGYQNVDTYHNAATDGKAVGSFFYYGTTSSGAYYYVGTSDSGTVDNDINYTTGDGGGTGTTFVVGDVLGLALDLDSDPPTVRHYVNGVAGGPAIEIPEGNTLTPYLGLYSASAVTTFNFGADPTFGGITVDGTSADASDENGNGKFYDTPPSGFLALCSANLPDVTIGPNSVTQATDHFNTVLYTGNGSTQDVVVGFQPDWLWIKNRENTYNHVAYDSSRGATKRLEISQSTAESTVSNAVTDFTATGGGFSLGGDGATNQDTKGIVAWAWKANGGTTTTNDASATSVGTIDSVYQANTTQGFSIVTHTGTGSAGTIAHGLGKKPALIITKGLSSGYSWFVYNHKSGATKATILNTTAAEDSYSTTYNNTEPTTSVFSVGTATATNGSGINYIHYIFAEIEGYSKFDKFVGNNLLDGPFVYLGFRPAWIMAKRADSTSDWFILDNKRSPQNVVGGGGVGQFAANQYYVESSLSTYAIVDFLSNGFKMRSDMNYGYWNASGGTYIYLAFAEQPFKFSNAR